MLTTYKAKGALPDPHPLAMGVFTGGALEEPFVRQADLIIAFGLDTVELIPRALALHRAGAEPHPLRVGRAAAARAGRRRLLHARAEVVGDLGTILEDLAPRIMRRASRRTGTWPRWTACAASARAALEVAVSGLAPHRVVQLARELTPEGTIATVDAGAHMFPTTAYWDATELGEMPHLQRAGHHGLRAAGGHRRPARPSRTGAWSASPATAAS